MKKLWDKIKWILKQARSSIFFLFIIILLGAGISILSIYKTLVLKNLIDSSTILQSDRMAACLSILAILIIIEVGVGALLPVILVRISTKISNGMQKRLYNHLEKSKWLEYAKFHSGDILTRITNDVDSVTNVIVNTVPGIISLSVTLFGSFIALLFFDHFLAILALTLAPVTFFISRIYGKKLKTLYTKTQEIESEYRSFLHESLQNITIIKAFCLDDINRTRIESIQDNRMKFALTRSRISSISNMIFSLGSSLGFFIMFGWGALNLYKGTISFGALTALIQLFGNLQGPFSRLAYTFPQVIYSIAAAERLMVLENIKTDDNDVSVPKLAAAGIQFDKICFGYDKHNPVLNNVSAELFPGEKVAIIGSSGEGKTTLVRLLLFLMEPQSGNVFFTNGMQKYRACTSSRELISYVPQGNTLFSGTIADNLRYGSPEASDNELKAALISACAWEFVENLPNGLYSVIGERGTGLSEGQAQRIAISRALLRKAPILILDEATSGLDMNTEIKVLQMIGNLNPARTCLIITHRTTALRNCDRVLKLENGYLSELTAGLACGGDYIADGNISTEAV